MSGDHWKIVVKTQWTDVERHFQVRCGYCHGFHPNEKLVQISECLMLQGAGVNNAGHGRMLVRQLDDTRVMPGWVYEPFLLLPAQLAVALLSRTIHHSQKIFRVRMIQEGHVRVVWINSNDKLATPRYTIHGGHRVAVCIGATEKMASGEVFQKANQQVSSKRNRLRADLLQSWSGYSGLVSIQLSYGRVP